MEKNMDNPENSSLLPEEPEIPSEEAIIPEDIASTEQEVESETAEPALTDQETEPVIPAEEEAPPPKEESRIRRFFRRLIRWTAGLLIIFGLGFITAVFTIYYPKVNELDNSKAELSTSDTTIADLQDRVDSLQGQIDSITAQNANYETRNQELLAEQNTLDLQLAILTARMDVANAQVALYAKNPVQGRIHLENTSNTLATIVTLLPAEQQDVVKPMQSRLELASGEIISDPQTAIADLTILASNLLELETSLLGE
jgi:hypothetical protein